jgi:predicted NBD/HSP70 family sugar kinase
MIRLTPLQSGRKLPVMATAAHLRSINQRRIVESMARLGKASRVELSRVAGISQPTVSRIVDQLLSQGLLMEAAEPEQLTAVGRPSTPLQLDTRHPRFAVLQVGVRKTRLSALPIAIPTEDRWQHEFDSPPALDLWAKRLASAWENHHAKNLKAIIVGLPGVVDEDTGQVLLSPNLRWTESAEFVDTLKRVLKHPAVIFMQEIRALALGHIAMNPQARDFLLVDSGSGLGAAAVLRGRLFEGALPLSGEIGHTPVLGNKRVCGCGSTGCSETLISRHGMLVSAREAGYADTWPELLKSLAKKPLPSWMQKTLDVAAVTIASAVNVLGVREVVLTGGFAELPTECIQYLEQGVRADAMWARFGSVSCKTALRHRQAGMVSIAIDKTLFVGRIEARRH